MDSLEISQRARVSVSHNSAIRGFINLRVFQDGRQVKVRSRMGLDTVDYFTLHERLHTHKQNKPNFYEFVADIDTHRLTPYIARGIASSKNNQPRADDIVHYYNVFKMYFGSCSAFKPICAIGIMQIYRPTHILDPCVGWGGRMVAAAAMDVPRYTGFDTNENLRPPYTDMATFLSAHGSATVFDFHFADSSAADLSTIDYDMVLTSPPYWNLEIYRTDASGGTSGKSKAEWVAWYGRAFRRWFDGLRPGGVCCLNIPKDVYDTVAVGILGAADEIYPLHIAVRNGGRYGEMIYVWRR